MPMPGFTADHALYDSTRRYRTAAAGADAPASLRPAAAVECVLPWDQDEYLPDPGSCAHFYQCSNGVPYRMPCPPGTHFNRTLNVCDWPENAGCV
jgi:hypothetical protein